MLSVWVQASILVGKLLIFNPSNHYFTLKAHFFFRYSTLLKKFREIENNKTNFSLKKFWKEKYLTEIWRSREDDKTSTPRLTTGVTSQKSAIFFAFFSVLNWTRIEETVLNLIRANVFSNGRNNKKDFFYQTHNQMVSLLTILMTKSQNENDKCFRCFSSRNLWSKCTVLYAREIKNYYCVFLEYI